MAAAPLLRAACAVRSSPRRFVRMLWHEGGEGQLVAKTYVPMGRLGDMGA